MTLKKLRAAICGVAGPVRDLLRPEPDVSSMLQDAERYLKAHRPHEADAICRRILQRQPSNIGARLGHAFVLFQFGRHGDAITDLEPSLDDRFDDPDFLYILAEAYAHTGRSAKAVRMAQRCHKVRGKDADGYSVVAKIYQIIGRHDDCLATLECGLERFPSSPRLLHDRAIALLRIGRYREGWADYEARHKLPVGELNPKFLTHTLGDKPIWNGEDLNGQSILLPREQGNGDVIQFIRYARLVAERGGRVILGCRPEQRDLLSRAVGVTSVVCNGDPVDFDCCTPQLLSLPHLFGTTLETIPAEVPYIHPNPRLVESWAKQINRPGMHVGIVWKGKLSPDPLRSCKLADFTPLAQIPGITFHALQIGTDADEARHPPAGMRLVNHAGDIHTFADTAAIMAKLDLIISIDSAPAHLAGALGRPVWTLLCHACCWRWLLNREDCPWYPTMRLFRQKRPGDWAGVFRRVADALRIFRRRGVALPGNKEELPSEGAGTEADVPSLTT